MKPSLKPGLKHSFSYQVPETKTVPYLYAESPQLQAMPEVFATGFMVGLMEWTCVQLLEPHLEPRHPYRYFSQGGDAAWLHRHRGGGMYRGEGAARSLQDCRS